MRRTVLTMMLLAACRIGIVQCDRFATAAPAWGFDTIYLTDYAVVIFADSGQSIVERVAAAKELA